MHSTKETPTIVLTLSQPLIVTTSRIIRVSSSQAIHTSTAPDDLFQFSVPVPVPVPAFRDFQLPVMIRGLPGKATQIECLCLATYTALLH